MSIPDRAKIKEALVSFIKETGGTSLSVTPQSAYRGLAEKFQLTKEDLALEREADRLWPNEVRWARQDLVDEGILLPREISGHAVWQINPSSSSSEFQSIPIAQRKTKLEELHDDLVDEGVFHPTDFSDAQDIILRAIVQRRGQQDFRRILIREYKSCCAVTGENYAPVLEAAHIIPYKGIETNHVQNGLLLRADIHTLFDLHLIVIDSNYQLHLSPSLQSTGYLALDGKQLLLPSNPESHPSKAALEQHRVLCDF